MEARQHDATTTPSLAEPLSASPIGVRQVSPESSNVRWRASLRTRLMLWIGILVALLLLVGFATAFFNARGRVLADAQARTDFQARQAADRIHSAMSSVLVSANSLGGLFGRVALDRNELLSAMEALLEANPSTVGGLIALEPGVLADGKPLARYVGLASRGVPDRNFIADGYQVGEQAWYRRTLAAKVPWWSEPYFNRTAGGRYMATLNLPLRDSGGRGIGMVSLDVPVQAFSASLEPLRTIAGLRPALYAPEGTIAVHPDRDVAFDNTLASFINDRNRQDLAPLEEARAKRAGLRVTHALGNPGSAQTHYSVLEPVGDTGWSVQLTLSQDAMLFDLERAKYLMILVALAVALAAALAVLRLARQVTVPLSQLATSASHFAAGEFDWPVPHDTRRDEVGVMARALERARDSIRQQLVEIERYATEKQKLESELDIARDIQLSMLPGNREIVRDGRRFNLQARLEPAKAVGGDFYSHFQHGPEQVWFVLGDVSDKGVPAALFMARAVTVLKMAALGNASPEQALVEAGRELIEDNDACMFATVICGALELGTGMLSLASAGHEPPLLRHADGRIEQLVLEPGPALGFDPVDAYDVWQGRLLPGDTLVVCTDGVAEAFDPDNQAFGDDRLETVARHSKDAKTACDDLIAAVHGFAAGAPQSDDITVFCLDCATVDSPVGRLQLGLRVPDERDRLPLLMDAVAGHLQRGGIARDSIHDALLVVEELVCNTMDHGIAPQVGGELDMVLELAGASIRFVYRDNCAAYDPLSQASPDLEADIGDRPIGGLGIHLIRTLASEVRYSCDDGWNTLHLTLDGILESSSNGGMQPDGLGDRDPTAAS